MLPTAHKRASAGCCSAARERRAQLFALACCAALGAAFLALAQGNAPVFEATFNRSLAAERGLAQRAARAEGAQRRVVSTRTGGCALVLEAGGELSFAAGEKFPLARGALELGVQPLSPMADGKNHYFFCAGEPGKPGSFALWKTARENDLRFRITADDGTYAEVIFPGAAAWAPGLWHHVLCTWNLERGELKLYVDSALCGSSAGRPIAISRPPERMYIGCAPQRGAARAAIDDVKLYNGLAGGRIAALYEQFLREERMSTLSEWREPPDALSLALLPKPDFTFAVISDPHISPEGAIGRYAHNWRVEELVRQLNALRPAFVLDAGDIVTTFPGRDNYDACAAQANKLFAKLAVPIYHTPGNHDIGNKLQLTFHPRGQVTESVRKGYFINPDNIALYRRWFGRDYYSFDYEGCHFVITNNALWNSGLPQEREQWNWLVRDLEEHKNARLTFVTMHNPLFWVSTSELGTENYENVNQPMRGKFIELMDKYRVCAVFTGHTHHRITNRLGATRYLTLPSTTFARGFAGSYGLPGVTVCWDPQRVGYYVCRVYGKQVYINLVRTYPPLPPAATLQEGNDTPLARALSVKPAEVEDSLFGIKSVPPPQINRSVWHVDGVIDGETCQTLGRTNVALHCWTSQAHRPGAEEEWLQVELARPVAAARIELWPRPGPFGFPSAFDLQVSADGKTWQTVAAKVGFAPPREGPATFALAGQPRIRFVRLNIRAVSPNPTNQGRSALAEIRVLDSAGRDHALLELGAKATCGSSAGGARITVDDHGWEEPAQAGLKWAMLPAGALPWTALEKQPGQLALPPHIARAFGLGRPPGLSFVVPVTTAHPAHPPNDPRAFLAAFRAYVRFLGDKLGNAAAGFALRPDEALLANRPLYDEVVRICAEELRRAAPRARFIVAGARLEGARIAPLPSADALRLADGLSLRLSVDGLPEEELTRALDRLRQARLPCEVWVELAPWRAARWNDIARSKLLARALILAAARKQRLIYWVAPPERGAILHPTYIPTPLLYPFKSCATLLCKAQPAAAADVGRVIAAGGKVQAQAFATPAGHVLFLWQGVFPETVEPARCTVKLIKRPRAAWLVDTLRCMVQKLKTSPGEGGKVEARGIVVRDYPVALYLVY